MIKTIAVILLCLIGWSCYQLAVPTVYLTPSDEHIDFYSGEKTVYFWVSNKHREMFQIGRAYQLVADQQQKRLELFTITYAEIKPDSLKLGFKLAKSDQFTAAADEYLVTAIPVVGQH